MDCEGLPLNYVRVRRGEVEMETVTHVMIYNKYIT